MAELKNIRTFSDKRGNLGVLESMDIPFEIKRLFYIYEVDDSDRGAHRHKKTRMALICFNGSCLVKNNDGQNKEDYILDRPDKCLILEPNDWHVITDFQKGTILLVLASEHFDSDDYIFEPYN